MAIDVEKARTFLNERPIVAIAVVGIAVLALVWGIWRLMGGGGWRPTVREQKKYFYHEKTGDLVALSAKILPPATGSDGQELPGAIVITPDNGVTRKIAYLFKYTPEAKSACEDKQLVPGLHETLVRLPAAGSRWVSAMTPEGQSVMVANFPPGSDLNQVMMGAGPVRVVNPE